MRTLSAGMVTHLATTAHTRCYMLRLDLADGTTLGLTDHDTPLSFNLGDGAISYRADVGALVSDISLSAGLDADSYEVTGPITSVITQAAILGGRYNHARARLFQVNWSDLTQGAIDLLAGHITEARIEGGKFIMEVRSDVDLFNQIIGATVTNNCRADHGDARCGRTPESTVGTVTAVTDALRFSVSYSGTFADAYFNQGVVIALTGPLTGTPQVEIQSWLATGAIEMFVPLIEAPAIGNTFTLKRGCGKSRADCMARTNILNFRGYPELPGSDQALRMPIPGQ